MITFFKSPLLVGIALLGLFSGCVQTESTTSTVQNDEAAVVNGVRTAGRVVVRQVASTPVKVATTVGHAAEVVGEKVESKVNPDAAQ